MFLRTMDIVGNMTDPETGERVQKSVFICFFQGGQLEARAKRICDGLVALQFDIIHSNAVRTISLDSYSVYISYSF